MATQPRKYKVAREFTDRKGRKWTSGQSFEGDENEARDQVNQGNLQEEGQGGQGGQQPR